MILKHKLYLILLVSLATTCCTHGRNTITKDNSEFSRNISNPQIYSTELFDDSNFSATNQNTNISHLCYPSCPKNIATSTSYIQIYHDIFVLSYNIQTKFAEWVGYKVEPNHILGSQNKRKWRADPKLPKEVALLPSDYKGAYISCNYDRGHLVPLGDFSNNVHWQNVNYLSNITPQKSTLNRGIWNDLENKIRSISKNTKGNIYVLAGSYYNDQETCSLPNARITHKVPNGYWKIITLVENDNIYRASFSFDQNSAKESSYCLHLLTVQEISKITNLKFDNNSIHENTPYFLRMFGCSK